MKEWKSLFVSRNKTSLWKVYQGDSVFLKDVYDPTLANLYVERCYQNSKIKMLQVFDESVRVEPGCYVREETFIGKRVVLMMGCIINIGASIDEDTMIDMGAVIGSGACVGKRCHIGANAVLAGCLEPMEEVGVTIEDDVFIGANATILSGVTVGKGAIVGAGSVVTKDVLPYTTVVGIPARVIKSNMEDWLNKTLR